MTPARRVVRFVLRELARAAEKVLFPKRPKRKKRVEVREKKQEQVELACPD